MAPTDKTRDQELRQLLTDTIEVQLAAFKTAIEFWRKWVEQTSEFTDSATSSLRTINSEQEPTEVLMELVDAGRASIRSMTELPRHTASRFIEELDELKKQRTKTAAPRTRAKNSTARGTRKTAAAKGAAVKKKSKARRKRTSHIKP